MSSNSPFMCCRKATATCLSETTWGWVNSNAIFIFAWTINISVNDSNKQSLMMKIKLTPRWSEQCKLDFKVICQSFCTFVILVLWGQKWAYIITDHFWLVSLILSMVKCWAFNTHTYCKTVQSNENAKLTKCWFFISNARPFSLDFCEPLFCFLMSAGINGHFTPQLCHSQFTIRKHFFNVSLFSF